MNTLFIVISLGFPLCIGAMWLFESWRSRAAALSVWTPLPPLLWALIPGGSVVELPWLMLQGRMGIDPIGKVFLVVTAVLWLAAGLYGRAYMAHDQQRGRYDLFFFLTMVGNLGVILSQDMLSFVFLYTLMSLSAYGLIAHDGRDSSHFAGRIYITLTIFGEVILFVALALSYNIAGSVSLDGLGEALAQSAWGPWVALLVIAGFGIKLGVMPLHFWLPLAHPAAPTPASAVLSGSMIKVGLLGYLRFLPIGVAAMPWLGGLLLVAGLVTALLAAVIGVTQHKAKGVLAYSSISQMGLVAIGCGVALSAPEAWTTVLPMLLLFMTHHAVAKAALFLGVGVAGAAPPGGLARVGIVTGLVVSALALPGLVFTTGYAAKSALKYAAALAPAGFAEVLVWALPISGITTTLLVSRYLYLVWPRAHATQSGGHHAGLSAGLWTPWLVLTVGVVLNAFLGPYYGFAKPEWFALKAASAWSATWPILVALAAVGIVLLVRPVARALSHARVPEGDLVWPVCFVAQLLRGVPEALGANRIAPQASDTADRSHSLLAAAAGHLGSRLVRVVESERAAGPVMALLAVLLLLCMLL